MYQMTPPGPVRQPGKPEKKGLKPGQILLIVLAVGLMAAYLIYTFLPAAADSALIQNAMVGSRFSGDCLIVRDEIPYDAEGLSSMVEIAEEGSLVHRGSPICKVYSSGFSTREMTALQEYRDDIRDYQMKQLAADTTADAKMDRLESDVLTRAREVRTIISGARGNLRNQESLLTAAIDARQAYLRIKFKDDQRMSRLYDEEQSQLQRISSWTKQYAAMSESLVSFYSDGYEYGLTADNYAQFTNAEVRQMINGQKPAQSTVQKGRTTIYRTIRDGHWYVLMLIRNTDWSPEDGGKYELKLEGFENTQVMATVTSHTLTGGELLLRLEVESPVLPILYIRTCAGEIGSDVSTMMVPDRALYTQDNMVGVVVIDGGNMSFIPVNVLGKENGYAYIEAIQQGVLFVGQEVRLF